MPGRVLFKEDFFERVIDVQWGGALAIEFGPGALYSDHPISDFSTATMAFWFRVPNSSFEQAYSEWNSTADDANLDGTLLGVVPLVSWGTTAPFTSYLFEGSNTSTIGPSYISASVAQPVSSSETEGKMPTPCLAIRFQSSNQGKIYDPQHEKIEISCGNAYTIGTQDGMIWFAGPNPPADIGLIDITPDEWHHLIVAYSIGGSSGQLWVALDGKNRSGKDFGLAHKKGDGPNNITAMFDVSDGDGTVVSGGFSFSSSPAYGVPTSSAHSSRNTHTVEMADFYLYMGYALDTTSNAGVFFTRDKDTGERKPAEPKDVAKKLQRDPDVLIRFAKNWKKGMALEGGDPSPKEIFTPSGSIESYKPDPTLE